MYERGIKYGKVTENSSFMYTIWLVLALICMGYYIVCATYAGVGSSFIFIWLMGAVFFWIGICSESIRNQRNNSCGKGL